MPAKAGIIKRMEALRVAPGSLGFYGLGQVGVAITGPEGVIYVDPYLTDNDGAGGSLERNFPPPLRPEEVTNASAVLVTHDHVDHFDPATLGPLTQASPIARFAGPYTCDFTGEAGIDSERNRVPVVGEPFEVAGATVSAVPSAHTGLDPDPERGHPYLGYVIEYNGVTVYHAGDTVIYDGLIETLGRWNIDVAFLPINGRDWFRTSRGIIGNTDFREAAHLTEELDVELVIPTHYDLFDFNAADPGHFVDYLYRLNPMRRQKMLLPGELHYFVKEDA